MEPDFSVIIPSYNRSHTVGRAIQSVLDQTYSNFEILVVDDGSTDNTSEILSHYATVKYIFQSNKGVCAARNRGATEAKGKWLIFLDSDDELFAIVLEEIKNATLKWPKLNVFCGGFSKNENQVRETYIPESAEKVIPLSGTYSIKKDVFLKIGGFDESLRYSENSELFLRLRSKRIRILPISIEFLVYNASENGGSRNRESQILSIRRILEIHENNLSKKEKITYLQILGVLYLRKNCFKDAKTAIFKAIQLEPFRLKNWIRLLLSQFPPLSKIIYS